MTVTSKPAGVSMKRRKVFLGGEVIKESQQNISIDWIKVHKESKYGLLHVCLEWQENGNTINQKRFQGEKKHILQKT